MSINQLEAEFTNVSKMIQDTEARKAALSVTLIPIIDAYFTARVSSEKNPELRRDFAYLNSSKNFEILNETTLRFIARNISGPIKHDVTITELLEVQ